MPSSLFYTYFCFFLFTIISMNSTFSSASAPTIPYSDHCSSVVPESSPTSRTYRNSPPHLVTSYITGGDQLLGRKQSNQTDYFEGNSLKLWIKPDCYETISEGVYKVKAFLYIWSPYWDNPTARSNDDNVGSYDRRRKIKFLLNGFWSEISRKLCMVGSASWQVEGGKVLDLNAVLKLNYNSEYPDIYTSVVSGVLESISSGNDPEYFDPMLLFDFPIFSTYNYSKELDGGASRDSEDVKNQSLDLQANKFCSVFSARMIFLESGYGGDESFRPFLSLNPLQCSWEERKLRFVGMFQNTNYPAQSFGLNSTFIGEASWEDKNNELFVVACQILNPADHFGNAVGDCTLRLSLRYPSIWTIRNDAKMVGQLWSTKGVEDLGYFKKINLTSFYENEVVAVSGLRYEYTELDKAKRLCPVKERVKKGNIYPEGHSRDMRFDISVEILKGVRFAWAFATPISVGNELYDSVIAFDSEESESSTGYGEIQEPDHISVNTAPLKISYKISISPYPGIMIENWFWSLNRSIDLKKQLVITAEGVYTAETGYLCMVGCRKLVIQNSTDVSTDCEILVKFEFAPLNEKRGGLIKGTIESTRKKSDPLYFEDLSLSSAAVYSSVAKRSIWRMDLEITMVLISNTLSCIFVRFQLFHVKRNPKVLSRISLVMLLILSLGHMVPLVLNFEALFVRNRSEETIMRSTGGWVEANEVIVRVMTMVAFLLQIRLVQLVWTAKQSESDEKSTWIGEKKAVLISLPLYILGGLLTLLLNWIRNKYGHKQVVIPHGFYGEYSLWSDLRSYVGLVLDGFLLPQILLNSFNGSPDKALSHPFYMGISAMRLVPHAYDLYRTHNYPTFEANETYYYANPTAGFYSMAWDVLIPCGGIALAVIIFLQQRAGGCCILPQRLRGLKLYEKVATVDNK